MSVAGATMTDVPAGTVTLPPRRFGGVLVVVGALAFVALCLWLLIVHGNDLRAWLVGPLGALFFGWAAIKGVRRLVAGWTTTLGPDGFTIAGPSFAPKLVAWRDVESIGTLRIGRNTLTGVRLKTCANLAAQYAPDEARRLLRERQWLGRFTRAAAPLAGVGSGVSREDLTRSQTALGEAKDLAAMFANRRAAYGYEILIGWADRDRGAEEFADYLEGFRRKYSGAAA